MPNYSWSFLWNCVLTLRNTLFFGLCLFRGEILLEAGLKTIGDRGFSPASF